MFSILRRRPNRYFYKVFRFYDFCKVAVAAVRLWPQQRRCSYSNFIFAKPIKTYEILMLFGSKSRFAYKSNGNLTFGPQILTCLPIMKYIVFQSK